MPDTSRNELRRLLSAWASERVRHLAEGISVISVVVAARGALIAYLDNRGPECVLALLDELERAKADSARLFWYLEMVNGKAQEAKREAVWEAWFAAHNHVGGIRTDESIRAAIDAARVCLPSPEAPSAR